jgi:DnaJ-class molecular chaperone
MVYSWEEVERCAWTAAQIEAARDRVDTIPESDRCAKCAGMGIETVFGITKEGMFTNAGMTCPVCNGTGRREGK